MTATMLAPSPVPHVLLSSKAAPVVASITPPAPHPLAALLPSELTAMATAVKEYNSTKVVAFRRLCLVEPDKKITVAFLQAELAGTPLPPAPTRFGQALFYFLGEQLFMEAIVDINAGTIVKQRVLENLHGPGDDDEVLEVAAASLVSPLVLAEIERLQLPEGCEVVAEPWPYGTDDGEPITIRLYQVWYYINLKANRSHPSANFYGHPLDFSSVFNPNTGKTVRIDRMPTTTDVMATEANDVRYQVNEDSEYAPDLIEGGVRTDLKPIHISQPEGVSFTVAKDGETIEWQKWKFRVNFDVREGIVLRNVCYDGRPLFYRMALSEMTVPYGDPRAPLHRKSAYDLGECGAGQTANNLALGCDCLGVIHYLDGLSTNASGNSIVVKNAICVHEQDAGISWKHTNIRTGRADVTRARELVLQLIVTVGNYEYILCWIFDTAATIHYETRATGIMSVTPIDMDADVTSLKYGTVVAPGVFAPHHQHIFNLRVDPAIDGYKDSMVAVEDTYSMPRNEKNPHGVGFEVFNKTITKESAFNLDWTTDRHVKIINPKKLNRFSKKPIAYKVGLHPTQLGLADPSSMHARRGEFVDNHIHVTKYAANELNAAGEHNWQSTGGQGGCKTWASRGRDVAEGESVLWLTFGFTHATKSEDWPVMPSETFRVHFKPSGFFERSPALDIAPSTQAINKSTKACCIKAE